MKGTHGILAGFATHAMPCDMATRRRWLSGDSGPARRHGRPPGHLRGVGCAAVGTGMGHGGARGPGIAVWAVAIAVIALPLAQGRDFLWGMHMPQGTAAVAYIFGTEGTFRMACCPLDYQWNYYPDAATPAHPYDRDALVAYAATHCMTCLDANKHLLYGNSSGELVTHNGTWSFHEHNGRGVGGRAQSKPFLQFWFDDNSLAQFMSRAYGRPMPGGLWMPSDFTRWQIVGGDTAHWTPYPQSTCIDLIALNGLFLLAQGDTTGASALFDRCVSVAQPSWDGAMQRFVYGNLDESYKVGLMMMLGGQLLASAAPAASSWDSTVQHLMSLRSNLLSRQEVSPTSGDWLGWRTNWSNQGSLINTETVSCAVLGLGSGANLAFEAGRAPLRTCDECSFFMRPHNALSAVVSLSKPGYLVWGVTVGPSQLRPGRTGRLRVYARSPSPRGSAGILLTLDVYDQTSGRTVASSGGLTADALWGPNEWTPLELRFAGPAGASTYALEFRAYWNGGGNLDIGQVDLFFDA